MDFRKVDASCWYRKYQLIPLSHSQLQSLILIQPLDPSHFNVIQSECYNHVLPFSLLMVAPQRSSWHKEGLDKGIL